VHRGKTPASEATKPVEMLLALLEGFRRHAVAHTVLLASLPTGRISTAEKIPPPET
jgi:hypothetical protein